MRDFADALEDVPDLAALEFELVPVVNVLILAAGTVRIIWTARLDPVRRRRDDTNEVGGGVPAFDLNNFDFDAFALDHEGHEDDKIIDASDAIAAERNGGDVEFDALTGCQVSCRHVNGLI